ncbi:MAG TPA: hypothetical protein EYP19_16700, partial [Desulfobacterales bacterium]|nr:hypothetical protein [Desulfobacterales bacterium]
MRTHQANLSRAMQWVGVTYTRRFHNRHGQSGHLFQGRYKSILVENDTYLVELSCYIHRNPLRAGLVSRLADYKWSSYLAYGYGRKVPGWLKRDLILSRFGRDDPHGAYRKKVQSYSGEEAKVWEDFRHGVVIGTEDFVDRIRKRYLDDGLNPEIPRQRRMLKAVRAEEVLKEASMVLGFDADKWRRSRRVSSQDRDQRDMLLYLLWDSGRFTNQQIGDAFGLAYSAVSRRVGICRGKLLKDK